MRLLYFIFLVNQTIIYYPHIFVFLKKSLLNLLNFCNIEIEKGGSSYAYTIKGKGSPVMENKAGWHHKVPTAEEAVQIKQDFLKRKEEALHE